MSDLFSSAYASSSFLKEEKRPSKKYKFTSDDDSSSTGAVFKIIVLLFLFLILIYNSGVASHAQVNLIVTTSSTTDKTLLAIASNLGWIAVATIAVVSIFLWISRKDDTLHIQGYLLYIAIALMIVLLIQGVMMLYVKGSVNGTTVKLDSAIETNLVVAGILSLVVVLIVFLFMTIIGFRSFSKLE